MEGIRGYGRYYEIGFEEVFLIQIDLNPNNRKDRILKMKKKTFYQTNIFWQLFCFILLGIFITCFIVGVRLVIGIIRNGLGEHTADIIISIVLLILYFTATFLILRLFIRLEHNNIHLTNEKIYMKDDWNNKKNKIQYDSEVRFVDIESVDIIWTKKNSKNESIRSRLISSFVEKPYLSIRNKKGEVINFCVMYVSKKDVVKMIDEVRIRMKNVGNDTNILKEDEVLIKMNRKNLHG